MESIQQRLLLEEENIDFGFDINEYLEKNISENDFSKTVNMESVDNDFNEALDIWSLDSNSNENSGMIDFAYDFDETVDLEEFDYDVNESIEIIDIDSTRNQNEEMGGQNGIMSFTQQGIHAPPSMSVEGEGNGNIALGVKDGKLEAIRVTTSPPTPRSEHCLLWCVDDSELHTQGTLDLQDFFLDHVNQLRESYRATPKDILQEMNVAELQGYNAKSYIQRYKAESMSEAHKKDLSSARTSGCRETQNSSSGSKVTEASRVPKQVQGDPFLLQEGSAHVELGHQDFTAGVTSQLDLFGEGASLPESPISQKTSYLSSVFTDSIRVHVLKQDQLEILQPARVTSVSQDGSYQAPIGVKEQPGVVHAIPDAHVCQKEFCGTNLSADLIQVDVSDEEQRGTAPISQRPPVCSKDPHLMSVSLDEIEFHGGNNELPEIVKLTGQANEIGNSLASPGYMESWITEELPKFTKEGEKMMCDDDMEKSYPNSEFSSLTDASWDDSLWNPL